MPLFYIDVRTANQYVRHVFQSNLLLAAKSRCHVALLDKTLRATTSSNSASQIPVSVSSPTSSTSSSTLSAKPTDLQRESTAVPVSV